MKNYLLSSRCARCLKMSKRLVNREELGKLIAQTSGAISMINESNYSVRSKSGELLIASLQLNHGGLVHVQIMRAIMPSASICLQLNFIAAVLGFFGFYRIVYSNIKKGRKKWYEELKEQRTRDIERDDVKAISSYNFNIRSLVIPLHRQ